MASGARLAMSEENGLKIDYQMQDLEQFTVWSQQAFQDTIKHQEEKNRKLDALIGLVTNLQTGGEIFQSKTDSRPGQEFEASIVDENQIGVPVIDEPFSVIEEELQEVEASGVDKNRMGVLIADQKRELTESSHEIDSLLKFKSRQSESFSEGKFSNPSMILSQRDGKFLNSDRLGIQLSKSHKDLELESSWIVLEFSEILVSKAAHQVFVEMLRKDVESLQGTDAVIGKPRVLDKNLIFDPGISVLGIGRDVSRCCLSNDTHKYHCNVGDDDCSNLGGFEFGSANFGIELRQNLITLPHDKVMNIALDLGDSRRDCLSNKRVSFGAESSPLIAAVCKEVSGIIVHQQGSRIAMPFDRGRIGMRTDSCREICAFHLLVFDPGGALVDNMLL